MNKITLEISDQLMNQLQNQTDSVQNILLKALEEYLAKEQLGFLKTKTWELCGSLEIPNPEPEFTTKLQDSKLSTNYAEHIDEVLY
ncbi:hypothetical protein VB711_00135 [Cronbergia sp. UHCC 0137]|uniref:hypothetical protein n=1 Tax=Cronbergia sp. UHCC 0137 TaxID=3110239 RepID=UPI002B215D7F|nr:hypothetical protein [Cronbergia sp. UHCC 0137]MEA5616251.1 hypothetical protein [Cronbergia sp. UHCC 0137]